jgi:cation diffusion facilitator family transporter
LEGRAVRLARSASPSETSITVVLFALAGNLAIAATKFAAFGFTRSAAMLTEAIHSTVDTGNQLLLLIGQRRGESPPDETHPFGYGMEVYFWSFIVALMVFILGGGVSVWQGVGKLMHPTPIERPWINLVVLAISAAFEGSSFRVAYRGYRKMVQGRDVRLFRFLALSKDPNLFATLLEDGGALVGIALAALGTVAAGWLGAPWADGAASVGIGVLLLAVAIFMANETRSLIAGEAAAPFIVEAVRKAVETDPRVASVVDLASLHLGPKTILIAITLRFRAGMGTRELEGACDELARLARTADPRICDVFLRPGGPPAE